MELLFAGSVAKCLTFPLNFQLTSERFYGPEQTNVYFHVGTLTQTVHMQQQQALGRRPTL
jgi:hypothetical protein